MYPSSPEELNIAIHVRLGDRTSILHGFESSYLLYIETFITTVAAAVTRRGLDTPLFHVFSETWLPCPTERNGTFAEFPAWPIDTYQVRHHFMWLNLSRACFSSLQYRWGGGFSCPPIFWIMEVSRTLE